VETPELVPMRYGSERVPVLSFCVLTLHEIGALDATTTEPTKLLGTPGGVDGVKYVLLPPAGIVSEYVSTGVLLS
jgi:hypothetical protein